MTERFEGHITQPSWSLALGPRFFGRRAWPTFLDWSGGRWHGSSRLQRLDAVDVNQRDVNKMVGPGIENGNPVPANGDNFRVPNLVGLAVGQPQFERLERTPRQPFPDRFCVYGFAFRKGKVTLANLIIPLRPRFPTRERMARRPG